MTTYECKECKAPVTMENSTARRACCCEAPIIANLPAVAYGRSAMSHDHK